VSLIHAFDPQRVVLGGGILQEPWLQDALGQVVYPMLKPSFRTCELTPAALGNCAGLMGAGYLARKL
jgi:predicted NBD/HSP70 family sugar kinase